MNGKGATHASAWKRCDIIVAYVAAYKGDWLRVYGLIILVQAMGVRFKWV